MPIKINGATSGSTTIAAPDTGGDETIVLSTALASKADYPSGGSNGDLLTKSGTTTAWAAPSVAGLTLITSGTFTTSSAVNVNNCFSATYRNYRIIVRSTSASDPTLRLRLRASGTDNTSSEYAWARINFSNTQNGASGTTSGNETFFEVGYQGNTFASMTVMDIGSPHAANHTTFNSLSNGRTGGNAQGWIASGSMSVTTSYDGFTLYPTSSTITGDFRVYGYRD